MDDHFALSKEWLEDFSTEYKLEIAVPFTCNVRADSVDEERVKLLKESGCRLVHFGIETGNEELRNVLLRKNISNRQIENAVGLLKKIWDQSFCFQHRWHTGRNYRKCS